MTVRPSAAAVPHEPSANAFCCGQIEQRYERDDHAQTLKLASWKLKIPGMAGRLVGTLPPHRAMRTFDSLRDQRHIVDTYLRRVGTRD